VTLLLSMLLAAAVSADPHSLANPEEVRPTHVALDLTVDFASKRLEGTAVLDLTYAEGAPPATLALDSRDLDVTKVTDVATGHDLAFSFGAPVPFLGRRLEVALGGERPQAVRIAYRTGSGATALQWLEPQQTTSGRRPFMYTQSESIHARSWIPCADSPAVRLTYDATIHVPPGTVAVMGAEHVEDDPSRGLFRFHMPESIPPYLMALAAGEITFRAVGPRTGVYAEPAVVERAAREFSDMEKMLDAAVALDGPYVWGRWDILVLPPSFPYGGMENPRLTFATPTILAGDKSLVNVVVHELAHSWSGNLVTNATWGDFWLNEGLTNYGERRIAETLYGKDFADTEWLLALRALRRVVADPKTPPGDTRLAVDLAGRDPDDGPPATIPYDKGAAFMQVLEEQVGRDRLDAFMRDYFAGSSFASMTTARFLEAVKTRLFEGDPQAWVRAGVDEWVHGTGLPSNVIEPRSRQFDTAQAAASRFAKDGSLDDVGSAWTTAEWQVFLTGLPHPLTAARMKAVDDRFHLSMSGNAEIRFAWLQHVAWSAYAPDYPALEDFLTHVGRQKFLRPIYAALMEKPETRDLAKSLYARARPHYHPIAAATLDRIVK
jgi:leukotriene-A4 hydrolase